MPISLNIRHLEDGDLELQGQLPPEELELELRDDLIRAEKPLEYQLMAQLVESDILLQGLLRLPLQCLCVRCLKPFEFSLELQKWTMLVPLEGDEKVSLVNDCVDLTPLLREDILLEFPQHPLCEVDCRGLPNTLIGQVKQPNDAGKNSEKTSAWAALDKLKLKH